MLKNIQSYRDPRVLTILTLGFSSGLPFLLTLATLQVWLTEAGITKTNIGLFSFFTLPYALKFLWAPIIDSIPFPFFSLYLGHRKGWMLGSQLLLVISLVSLGSTSPETSIGWTALATFFVTFSSATQDIAYEAFRVESIPIHLQGLAAGASSFGYRIGMLASGAGALYLATSYSWFVVYVMMASLMVVGIITLLLSPPEKGIHTERDKFDWSQLKGYFKDAAGLFLRSQSVVYIFSFIFLYKIGDTVLSNTAMPFLLGIGFDKIEIANVDKAFGITFIIIGGFLGGLLLHIRPVKQVLIIVSFLQIISSILFMVQAFLGHNLLALFITIGFEKFSIGLGTAAFIYYLSKHCFPPYTGTHFAFLSSFGSLSRIILTSIAGWLADHISWVYLYGLTAILCVPCLVFLHFFAKKNH